MSLTVKEPDRIPPIEGGTYQAICYSVIDIGTHHSDLYKKDIKQTVITWEVPEVRIDIDRNGETVNLPRAISKTYTSSLSEKSNLYAHLVSWRGKQFTQEELQGFSLRNILNANCILTIVNETNKKNRLVAKVAGVAKTMKAMEKLEPENPVVSFDMDEDGVTNIPESIPDWVKEQIKESIEYNAVIHAQQSPELAEAQKAAGLQPHQPEENSEIDEPQETDDIPF